MPSGSASNAPRRWSPRCATVAQLTLVPNVAHDMAGVLPAVQTFFRQFLKDTRMGEAQ